MARIKQHQYEVKKEDIVSTMETIISVSDSEANSFIESLNPVGSSRYYSASVGNTSTFYASNTSAATYFSYQSYIQGDSPSVITDPLRRYSGLYWVQEELQVENNLSAIDSRHVCHLRTVADAHRIPLEVSYTNMLSSAEGSLVQETWVLANVNHGYLAKSNDYLSFLDNLNPSQVYEDFVFSAPRFEQRNKLEPKLESIATNMVDIHGDYNYFDRDYETLTSNSLVHEATLPNMYVFFAYQEQQASVTADPNPAYDSLLTLDGSLNIVNHQDMFTLSESPSQIKVSPSEKYFSEWVKSYSNLANNQSLVDSLAKKFTNIHLSADDVKKIHSYGGRKELFPMWMNVEFTTDRIVEFAETLKETQVMGILQSSLMEAVRTGSLSSDTMFKAHTEKNNYNDPSNPEAGLDRQHHDPSASMTYYDMDNWVQDFSNNVAPSQGYDSLYATFLGTLDESMRISDDPKYNFFKSLMAVILRGKMRKLLRKHTRTVQEMFSGKSCYNETVMYRIEKYDGAATGVPLQTFYVPNSHELDTFQYIDTQVKYNKTYTYVVYAYQIVVGNKYYYTDSVRQTGYPIAAALIKNEPSLRLYEVKIHEHTNKVLDNPPIHPEVEFIPYKGVNDKIKIIMNSGIGRYTLPYRIVEFEEQAQIDDIKKAQNRGHEDDSIRFETDDYPAFYEIRRTTTKPKSHRDFAGKLVQLISTSKHSLVASGVAFDDKIKPNNKYYYCIRAVDNHGHVSYPSPIYEVEMVDDKGSVYPIVRVCEFEKEIKSQSSIGGKRYIRLKPAMPQTILNEEASGLLDATTIKNANDLTLGIADESLWNKKLKIRLVSRSTGRKIDFNVEFKHQHNKLKEDK